MRKKVLLSAVAVVAAVGMVFGILGVVNVVRWDKCSMTSPFVLGLDKPGGLYLPEDAGCADWEALWELSRVSQWDETQMFHLNDYTTKLLLRFMKHYQLAVAPGQYSFLTNSHLELLTAALSVVEQGEETTYPLSVDTRANNGNLEELKGIDLDENLERAREWFSPLNPKTQKQLLAFMEENQLYIRPGVYDLDPSWPLERVLGELSFYSLDEDLRYTFDNTLWQDEDDTSYSDCACREG